MTNWFYDISSVHTWLTEYNEMENYKNYMNHTLLYFVGLLFLTVMYNQWILFRFFKETFVEKSCVFNYLFILSTDDNDNLKSDDIREIINCEELPSWSIFDELESAEYDE